MTRNNEAFYGMTLKVRNLYLQNTTAIGAIASIPPFFDTLLDFITQLANADAGSRADLRGIAQDKDAKRDVLENICLKISNALAINGVVNNNRELVKRADYPTSHWDAAPEEELMSDALVLQKLVLPPPDGQGFSVEGFGAEDATDIPALGTALTEFTNAVSNPSLAADVRKEDNLKIRTIIDEMRTHFKDKLDIMMRAYEINNPSLYNLYQSARAIDLNGSVSEPTAVVEVPAGSVMDIYVAEPYDADRLFTFQNMSDSTALDISLSNTENEAGPEPLLLPAGETRQRLASNLAPEGTHLIAANTGELSVTVRLWVV